MLLIIAIEMVSNNFAYYHNYPMIAAILILLIGISCFYY